MKKIMKILAVLIVGLLLVSCKSNFTDFKVINFESNGGSQVLAIIYSSENPGTLPENPIMGGYTFSGWYLDNDTFQNPFDLSSSDLSEFTEEIVVYAKWIVNQYSLHFNENGGTDVADITQDYNTLVTAPNNPEKVDYLFAGWYIDQALTIPFEFDQILSEDISLYAKWQDNIFSYTLNEQDEAIITGIIPDTITTYLEVPETVDGYPVISVDANAFNNHTNIITLTLPNSIETLPMAVLKNLSELEILYIPFVGESRDATSARAMLSYLFCDEEITSFTNIDRRNLYISSHLTRVILTDATKIEDSAFSGVNLDSVYLNEGIVSIGFMAFSGQGGISSISIPASTIDISVAAFAGATNLHSITVSPDNPMYSSAPYPFSTVLFDKNQTKIIMYPGGRSEVEYTIPEGITEIGDFAFFGSQLSRINIPASVQVIGMSAFEYSKYLVSVMIEANSQLTLIDEFAFRETNIIQIIIPSSVQTIGQRAFENIKSLSSLTFEANSTISRIDYYAFSNCQSLKSIIIPLSVETLGFGIFHDIREIVINAEATEKPAGWSVGWSSEGTVVWGYTN